MSHFTVLVIGPNPGQQLQPYHEFECTGINDEHVVDVDITDEVRKEYEEGSRTFYILAGGERVTDDDPRLYREFTAEEVKKHPYPIGSCYGGGICYESRDWGDGRGRRAKVWDPSANAESCEVPYRECMTLLEYARYSRGDMPLVGAEQEPDTENDAKYSYIRLDPNGEVSAIIDRTNPNSKWDWWVLGGRWCGFFPIKSGASGIVGRGAGAAHGLTADPGTADQLRVCDVDFDRAHAEAEVEATRMFGRWQQLVDEHGRAKSFAEVREETPDIAEARKQYHAQPLIQAANKSVKHGGLGFGMTCPVVKLGFERDVYVKHRVNSALVPYAVVKDGVWIAKGEMGFFAISDDKASQADWNEQVHRIYSDLPPDTLLTLVDCHC